MNMSTIKTSLTKNGFSEYKSSMPTTAESTWQIKICDDSATLYFIQADVCNGFNSQMPDVVEFSANLDPDDLHQSSSTRSPLYEVLFQPKEWITLTLHGSSVNQAMKFFAKAYKNLNCVPDRHNN